MVCVLRYPLEKYQLPIRHSASKVSTTNLLSHLFIYFTSYDHPSLSSNLLPSEAFSQSYILMYSSSCSLQKKLTFHTQLLHHSVLSKLTDYMLKFYGEVVIDSLQSRWSGRRIRYHADTTFGYSHFASLHGVN